MRYVYIDQTPNPGETVLVTGGDKHHITSVLRLKPGDVIGLLDGRGFEYPSEIIAISTKSVEVRVKEKNPVATESPVDITVAQGYLKEKKMDDLVRQLTELGIARWMPFMAARSVPKPDQKQLAHRMKRWQAITKEAVKQCRRGRVMAIGTPLSFEDMLNAAAGCDIKIVFWESQVSRQQTSLQAAAPDPGTRVFVIIGPEGGLTEAEVNHAKSQGFIVAGLAPRILRAETATLPACTLVQHLFGDMR
ncbi:MAG: 16S rRNA (uracil(1498)-N(3))-methyltransferase [Desulfobacterales bacterium]